MNEEKRPGIVKEKIYSHASGGSMVYSNGEQTVRGFVNGNEIGQVGVIHADGMLELFVPDAISEKCLGSQPGTDTLGGTLSTVPRVHPWKTDSDMMVLVYVTQDFGAYKKGWNYANMKHEMVESTDGYKWVVMEEK